MTALPRPPLLAGLTREAGAALRPGPRMVDEAECVCSVLLAILLAHAIGVANVSWAAFSGYMVMRGHVAESLLRGLLRIIGTLAGAELALLLVPLLHAWPAAAIVGAGVGGATFYGALTGRRAYAWLFVGLTFEMILLDSLEHPALHIGSFATTRLLEVLAGTASCVGVSCLSALTLRRRWPAERSPPARGGGWHPHAARHAAQAASALLLLPLLWHLFGIPQLAQSAVTIMAVMLLPLSSLGASGFAQVSRRLLQRIAGCLAGSALAALILLAAQERAAILMVGTALGVAVGRHIENSQSRFVYIGTQFVLAILVTLVPDSYAHAAIGPAVERLTGILIGMALLEPVLLAWRWLTPRPAGPGTAPVEESLDA